ncbi:response regulator transcription factor [Pseudonocardia sp. RS11V-5]|uniref:helix-turn-helix transcriptional regulator n=1 Tax=Pseudonocardia terrae TaxID=2905831 RepID=UPI001E426452|nr:response regulator transcription factor [Pseudonocardia terrae]MCE3556503.1 response regulator transcription factor [Pseudonocardia terrae]
MILFSRKGAGVELAVLVVGELPVPGVAVRAAVPPADALAAARALRPQVVLVDADAGPAALQAVETLAAALPELPVVGTGTGPELVLDVVRAGATGYVLRTDPALAEVLRAAAAGGPAFGEGLAERALDAAARAHGGAADAATPRLTERESEVLRLVVEGLTARQIATRLVLSPRTVENHIQRTLRKFDVPGRAALVRYAIEHGLA